MQSSILGSFFRCMHLSKSQSPHSYSEVIVVPVRVFITGDNAHKMHSMVPTQRDI